MDKTIEELPESRGLLGGLKGEKVRNIIIVLGIAGIALIALSTFWPKSTSSKADQNSASTLTAEEFVQQTEKKLTELIGSIEGAGECRVMVTLENGVEYVYATEEDVDTDKQQDSDKLSQSDKSKKSIIIVDTQDGRKGLLVTEIQPTVKGVVVICTGGDQEAVVKRITDTVTTALNITEKRVCVTKLSK